MNFELPYSGKFYYKIIKFTFVVHTFLDLKQ